MSDENYVTLSKRITETEVMPDARMTVATSYYDAVLRTKIGVNDN